MGLGRKLAVQIGKALCDLHKNGVVHRDVTPNNIIFDDDEEKYLLIDFNVAFRHRGHGNTEIGDFIGTRHWASRRRQKTRSGKYHPPSPLDDFESLFLTLYELQFGYNQEDWPALQAFTSNMRPKIEGFMLLWYERLVEYQIKPPSVKDEFSLNRTSEEENYGSVLGSTLITELLRS